MSKAFDTINLHPLIHKIHNTKIPATIQKFTANYIKAGKHTANSTTQQLNKNTSKLEFPKEVFFHLYFSTYTCLTYLNNHKASNYIATQMTSTPSPLAQTSIQLKITFNRT